MVDLDFQATPDENEQMTGKSTMNEDVFNLPGAPNSRNFSGFLAFQVFQGFQVFKTISQRLPDQTQLHPEN